MKKKLLIAAIIFGIAAATLLTIGFKTNKGVYTTLGFVCIAVEYALLGIKNSIKQQ
ncbi:MAG: hypothetical protein ACTHMM_18410 [Agriterribacter sp.]